CVSSICILLPSLSNDTATTESYTLSLHDALPICTRRQPSSPATGTIPTRASRPRFRCRLSAPGSSGRAWGVSTIRTATGTSGRRSEEHTSELQSRVDLVCRLLLEKKKIVVHTKS